VQYEWKPSKCEKCKIFDHSCPPQIVPDKGKGIASSPQIPDLVHPASLSLTTP